MTQTSEAIRDWLTRELEASLRRLQTDHVGLQIRRPSPDTDIEETLSALTDLMRAGKVRAIGSSTFPASEIVEAQWVSERRGLARLRTEQPPYSIHRSASNVRCCRYASGMGWVSCDGMESAGDGAIDRSLSPGQQPPGGVRTQYFPEQMSDERRLDAVERLIPVADEAGLPLTHVAMAFVMAHPGVTWPLSARTSPTPRRSARGRRRRS